MQDHKLNRREWVAGIGAVALSEIATAAPTQDMPYRPLGATGVKVSCIGMGGSHIGKPKLSEGDSIKLMRSALDRGLNFMDNSWDYNNGQSEIRMGKALKDGYRQKAFLMTKIDGRTKEEASKQIDESLKRLQVDHVDLLQHHEIIRFEDPDRIFAPGGAMEAFLEAKKAGRSDLSGLPGTRIRISIFICSKWPRNTAFTLIPRRCPSTSWMRTSAVSRNSWHQSL